MKPPGVSGNIVDFFREPGEPSAGTSFFFSFQNALCVSVYALCSGREGQDLGLPLLHVLGKKPLSGMYASLNVGQR